MSAHRCTRFPLVRRALHHGVVILVAILGIASPGWAATPEQMFEAGNTAYEEGRFDEAVEQYQKIILYGVSDPRVHYNLANAEFKLGRLGAAILHYERALKIDPSDREARENLDLARGLIRDRVPEPEIQYPLRAVKRFLDMVTPDGVSYVLIGFYFLAAGLAGAIPLTREDGRRRLLAYGAAAAGLCVLIVGGALAYKVQDATAERAIVMTDRVDVYSGPARDNTVLFTVHEGTRLDVRNRLEGWYQVSLPNALSGWVPAATVEKV